MTDFRFICVPFILFILDLKILSVTERHSFQFKVSGERNINKYILNLAAESS